ncbi:MAG: hypothetical protein GY696_18405 [Gammaproteobacteria bacterium]|nr:hypothetical protein [Gammaproteobacteria bacterium]
MAEEIKKPAKEEVRVALTQEPSKVSPIAVTGPIMFQQMDFISDLLEQRLKRSNISTFFMDMRQRVETTENLVRACGDPSYLKVPLEQSSFDQHQAILAVKGVFMLATAITKDDYGDVQGAREVADAIDQALMMVKCGTEWKKPWAHGIQVDRDGGYLAQCWKPLGNKRYDRTRHWIHTSDDEFGDPGR